MIEKRTIRHTPLLSNVARQKTPRTVLSAKRADSARGAHTNAFYKALPYREMCTEWCATAPSYSQSSRSPLRACSMQGPLLAKKRPLRAGTQTAQPALYPAVRWGQASQTSSAAVTEGFATGEHTQAQLDKQSP